MKSDRAKLGGFAVVGLAGFFAIGCSIEEVSVIARESAIGAVRSELRPTESLPVVNLEAYANPEGEGMVVIVKPESGCAPKYTWIFLGQKKDTYALDDATHALTPGLPMLREASPSIAKRSGAEPEGLKAAVVESICRSTSKQ